jgi:pantoate--beta-alanine ligase
LANQVYTNVDAYFHDNMIIFKKKGDWNHFRGKIIPPGATIGFVPTMGALHEGHISLLKKSKQLAGITVSSIFINPTQFNNASDFKKYPVNTEQDILMLEKNSCDFLFLPAVKEIYPEDVITEERFELGYLETILEGKYRPGHFQGVCQVVKRLLEAIRPDYLVTGQKDFQQCMILKKLLSITNSRVQMVICPTVREQDGLAMSSRNLRLSPGERKLAPEIFKTLTRIKDQLPVKDAALLKAQSTEMLERKGFKVDYIEIADADGLKPIDHWNGNSPVVILAAAFINDIRLIDNIVIQN